MKEGQDRVRSDKARVLALGVLCLLVSSVAEAQQGFTCPEAQRVRVELPKWTAWVLAASAGSPKLGQALAELRFGPDAAPLEGVDVVVCEEPFKVAGVDLFQVGLTEAAEKDMVVQVRRRGCEEDGRRSRACCRACRSRPRTSGAGPPLHHRDALRASPRRT